MRSSIETRELITWMIGGIRLQGTHHKARHYNPGARTDRGIGVLFLNSGFAPRTWGGDVAVYWADSFANCGYPSFRFDLPGLGDSDGDLPMERLAFAHLVNRGHYAAFVSNLAKNLTERFNLSGVVLVGHCAGAVSAIYAAAASRHVKGLVALDPYFFQEEAKRAPVRTQISHWVTRNQLARELSNVYGRFKKLRLLARRKALPENANLSLIRCWWHVASLGVPMLVLNARAPRPRQGDFDYLGYLQRLSGPRAPITIQFIEGTNHSFADAMGKAAVRRHCEQWLNACFPLREREQIAFSEQIAVNS